MTKFVVHKQFFLVTWWHCNMKKQGCIIYINTECASFDEVFDACIDGFYHWPKLHALCWYMSMYCFIMHWSHALLSCRCAALLAIQSCFTVLLELNAHFRSVLKCIASIFLLLSIVGLSIGITAIDFGATFQPHPAWQGALSESE
jgi:hypothetical protein